MQFDRDALRLAIQTIPCRHCGSKGAEAAVEMEGPHFMRLTCHSCGRFLDWLGWPPEAEPRKRRPGKRLLTRIGEDHCEICGRSRFEIPLPGQLIPHHVIPVETGGSDDADNLRAYCSSCHGLVEWARTYFGHYHPEPVEDEAA